MNELHTIVYGIFKTLRMTVAWGSKQLERQHGLQGAHVKLQLSDDGPAWDESVEGVTLRLWSSLEGPSEAIYSMRVLGYIWARLSTEPADRCIGAVVCAGSDAWQWVALPAGFDLVPGGAVMMHGAHRPGVERFLELFHQFSVQATARWAGRLIDQHMGGDGA